MNLILTTRFVPFYHTKLQIEIVSMIFDRMFQMHRLKRPNEYLLLLLTANADFN